MTTTTADDVALRLAIAAHPACETARLAYLDYLCERADDGDERARVRAEFVRSFISLWLLPFLLLALLEVGSRQFLK